MTVREYAVWAELAAARQNVERLARTLELAGGCVEFAETELATCTDLARIELAAIERNMVRIRRMVASEPESWPVESCADPWEAPVLWGG